MASYTRLGSFLLASELTADPSGKIHRGLTLSGGGTLTITTGKCGAKGIPNRES